MIHSKVVFQKNKGFKIEKEANNAEGREILGVLGIAKWKHTCSSDRITLLDLLSREKLNIHDHSPTTCGTCKMNS